MDRDISGRSDSAYLCLLSLERCAVCIAHARAIVHSCQDRDDDSDYPLLSGLISVLSRMEDEVRFGADTLGRLIS